MKLWTGFIVGTTLVLVLPLAIQAQMANDPQLGLWKLNLVKSKFDPGPAPKDQVRSYMAILDGIMGRTSTVAASGEKRISEVNYKSSIGSRVLDACITSPSGASGARLLRADGNQDEHRRLQETSESGKMARKLLTLLKMERWQSG